MFLQVGLLRSSVVNQVTSLRLRHKQLTWDGVRVKRRRPPLAELNMSTCESMLRPAPSAGTLNPAESAFSRTAFKTHLCGYFTGSDVNVDASPDAAWMNGGSKQLRRNACGCADRAHIYVAAHLHKQQRNNTYAEAFQPRWHPHACVYGT